MTKQENEKIVYGSLITSTKCYTCIHFPLCFEQKGAANLELASDCCYYQPKPPEDSVVLSKEEYEVLKIKEEEKHWFETCMTVWKNAKIYSSEETAKKIYTKIKDSFLMDSKNRYTLKLWLKEQFGVDIYE